MAAAAASDKFTYERDLSTERGKNEFLFIKSFCTLQYKAFSSLPQPFFHFEGIPKLPLVSKHCQSIECIPGQRLNVIRTDDVTELIDGQNPFVRQLLEQLVDFFDVRFNFAPFNCLRSQQGIF